ncbi:MAG: hypothetical protein ABSF23_06835 [Terracidiphilus sp.]|jgi:hypothetical protein
MMRSKLILGFLLAAVTAPAAPAAEHYAITPGLVAATMSQAGMQVTPDQVTLLANVVATTPAPALKVASVQKLNDRRFLARMECRKSEECLPFFVSLGAGQKGGVQGAPISPDLQLAGLTPRTAARAIVLRNGSPAKLLLDGNHVHISIPVICLESGAPGQTIRVTDKAHRMVFMAEVVDGTLLKGRLQ